MSDARAERTRPVPLRDRVGAVMVAVAMTAFIVALVVLLVGTGLAILAWIDDPVPARNPPPIRFGLFLELVTDGPTSVWPSINPTTFTVVVLGVLALYGVGTVRSRRRLYDTARARCFPW